MKRNSTSRSGLANTTFPWSNCYNIFNPFNFEALGIGISCILHRKLPNPSKLRHRIRTNYQFLGLKITTWKNLHKFINHLQWNFSRNASSWKLVRIVNKDRIWNNLKSEILHHKEKILLNRFDSRNGPLIYEGWTILVLYIKHLLDKVLDICKMWPF